MPGISVTIKIEDDVVLETYTKRSKGEQNNGKQIYMSDEHINLKTWLYSRVCFHQRRSLFGVRSCR